MPPNPPPQAPQAPEEAGEEPRLPAPPEEPVVEEPSPGPGEEGGSGESPAGERGGGEPGAGGGGSGPGEGGKEAGRGAGPRRRRLGLGALGGLRRRVSSALRRAMRALREGVLDPLLWPNVRIAVLERFTLSSLDRAGLLDALPCLLSESGASRVRVVVAPAEGRRVWPVWRPLLRRALDPLIERCGAGCADPLSGRGYPDSPSLIRCMVVERGDGSRVAVIVQDM